MRRKKREREYFVYLEGSPEDWTRLGSVPTSDEDAVRLFEEIGVLGILPRPTLVGTAIAPEDFGGYVSIQLNHNKGRAKTKQAVELIVDWLRSNAIHLQEHEMIVSGTERVEGDTTWEISNVGSLSDPHTGSKLDSDSFELRAGKYAPFGAGLEEHIAVRHIVQTMREPWNWENWAKVLLGARGRESDIQITIVTKKQGIKFPIIEDIVLETHPRGYLDRLEEDLKVGPMGVMVDQDGNVWDIAKFVPTKGGWLPEYALSRIDDTKDPSLRIKAFEILRSSGDPGFSGEL